MFIHQRSANCASTCADGRLGPPEKRRQQLYNENWSYPIPPKENRLKVRIEAGEKKYHEDH